MKDLEPKLVTVLRERLSRRQLLADGLAGVVVGIVAFPLAIAFAIASGVRPEQGLVTAIVAGLVISALSGSRVQIGGPTGAFVVLIYGIVERFGYSGLAVATLLAGFILIAFALARLGAVIRFVPYPVTVGFTAGIAIIIAASQVRDAFGLAMDHVPAAFIDKLVAYARSFSSVNGWALGLTAGTILIVELWPRVSRRIPGPLVAIVATAAAARIFHLPVDTIGTRFGSIAATFPAPRLPHVAWSQLPLLVSPAVSIALLGGIESLLSAVVADGMTGRRHRSNAELLAQGVANVASPLFGGIPATGAIARTATNVRNGGRTPIAGIVHAVTLLAMLLAAGPWVGLIPMATLAGILLVVAWNMAEWHVVGGLLRGPRSDVIVLAVTFLLTVVVDLVVAIQVGVLLAALLFMKRMAEVTQVRSITAQLRDDDAELEADPATAVPSLPAGVEVFEIRGSFFFGSVQKFSEVIGTVERRPRVVVLHMRDVLAMDASALRALDEVRGRFQGHGTTLVLAGLHAQPLLAMEAAGLLDRMGAENVRGTLEAAVEHARRVVEGGATARIA